MSKKLIAIPEGSLMRVAATQSITTLTALKEKTGVDRKTLRAINTGQPVKETTLQSIADRLRVPLAHIVGTGTPDHGKEAVSADVYQRREIKLRRLDATGLRRLADQTGRITWLLKIDQIPEEVEALLTKLEQSLEGWFVHSAQIAFASDHQISLTDQIARVKTSAHIDRIVEELAQKKLNIYGGSYVRWRKEVPRDPDDDFYPISPPTLEYTSRHTMALCITPEAQNALTVVVDTGWEPPQNFDFVESEPDEVDFVKIDGRKVWSRNPPFD
jgi:hypothetical protein